MDYKLTSGRKILMELHAGRADGSWDRQLNKYLAPDLLIVDGLGLTPLRQDEPLDLYEVIRRRYEKGSLIVERWRSGIRSSTTCCCPQRRWIG